MPPQVVAEHYVELGGAAAALSSDARALLKGRFLPARLRFRLLVVASRHLELHARSNPARALEAAADAAQVHLLNGRRTFT
jgi:hypothetical protein